MKDRILVALLVAMCVNGSFAQSKSLKVKGIYIDFVIKNALINTKGNFKKASATLTYDAANPTKSKFIGIVDAKSINTSNNLRDGHLKDKEEFFDVKKYPEIKMESTKITKDANGKFMVTWNITMKGITKAITVPVNIVPGADGIAFSSSFVINRRDWNVGEKSNVMSDNVKLNILVNAL